MGSEITEFNTLVVGPADDPEMHELLNVLRAHTAERSAQIVAGVREAARLLKDQPVDYALGLVLHTVPGEHETSDVLSLLAAAPLTRWLVVNGFWCESVGRTESVWPLAFQVPLRLLEPRLEIELQVIQGAQPALAATAGRDEVFEFNASSSPQQCLSHRVFVDSPDSEVAAWISELLRRQGVTIVKSVSEADAMIVDVDPWCSDFGFEELEKKLQYGSTKPPVIAIQSMPTLGRTQELTTHGIARVVPKLAVNHVLADTIEDVLLSND